MGPLIADIALSGIALLSVLIGAKRGFIKTVIHYLKFVLAVAAAYALGDRFPNPIVGYVAVFLTTLILLWLVAILLTKTIEHIPLLGGLNSILGAVLGGVIAVTLLLIVASTVKALWGDTAFYTDSVILRFLGDSSLLEKMKFLDIGKAYLSRLSK